MKKLARILLVVAVVTVPMSAFAGVKVNGVRLNGVKYNGVKFNGIKFNGTSLDGASDAPVLKGVHADRGRLTR